MDNTNPFTKPEPNPDLALFTSDELLDELAARFDAIVFASEVYHEEDTVLRMRRVHGSQMTCSGLGQWVSRRALQLADEASEDFDG